MRAPEFGTVVLMQRLVKQNRNVYVRSLLVFVHPGKIIGACWAEGTIELPRTGSGFWGLGTYSFQNSLQKVVYVLFA